MEFGEFLWSLLVIFFMIMYFMILFSVVIDLFRNHQMGGFAKALWIIFLIFVPLISLLIYVIVYGKSMAQRQQAQGRHHPVEQPLAHRAEDLSVTSRLNGHRPCARR